MHTNYNKCHSRDLRNPNIFQRCMTQDLLWQSFCVPPLKFIDLGGEGRTCLGGQSAEKIYWFKLEFTCTWTWGRDEGEATKYSFSLAQGWCVYFVEDKTTCTYTHYNFLLAVDAKNTDEGNTDSATENQQKEDNKESEGKEDIEDGEIAGVQEVDDEEDEGNDDEDDEPVMPHSDEVRVVAILYTGDFFSLQLGKN